MLRQGGEAYPRSTASKSGQSFNMAAPASATVMQPDTNSQETTEYPASEDHPLQTDSSFVSTLAGRNSATSSVRTTAKAARPDTFSISAQRNPSCVSFLQTTANKWAKEAFTKSQSLQHAWPTTVSSSSGPPSAGKQNTDSSRTLSPRPPLQTHSSR
jgi:hypothetical protein